MGPPLFGIHLRGTRCHVPGTVNWVLNTPTVPMHSGSYFKMAVLHTLRRGKAVHVNMLFRPSLFRNAIFWNSRCTTQQIMYHDSEKKNMCRKVRLFNKCGTLRIPSVCVSSCMSSFNDSPDISILVSLIF